MKITSVDTRAVEVRLTRPYEITGHRLDAVSLIILELDSDRGVSGFGQASPAPEVTGETGAACLAELEQTTAALLVGRDPGDPALARELEERLRGPAARAAVDIALCDLVARAAGVPFVERLGRVHRELPTSVTIGQKSVAATLDEADEYVARGFSTLKVKTGSDIDEDLERLRALRRRFGRTVTLRVDANQGYDESGLLQIVAALDELELEMIEQPLPRGAEDALRGLPPAAQRRMVADESVHDAAELEELIDAGCPFGIVNVKLMKCGGPRAALRVARLCARSGIELMWGCMDESVLGIAAALHTALSCEATRYLDLDGSFDLEADPFSGGFELAAGKLDIVLAPGLGALPT